MEKHFDNCVIKPRPTVAHLSRMTVGGNIPILDIHQSLQESTNWHLRIITAFGNYTTYLRLGSEFLRSLFIDQSLFFFPNGTYCSAVARGSDGPCDRVGPSGPVSIGFALPSFTNLSRSLRSSRAVLCLIVFKKPALIIALLCRKQANYTPTPREVPDRTAMYLSL